MSAPDKKVDLPQGPIQYRDVGRGEPILFIHGLLVNGRLWERAAERLSGEYRCILPDWPMGSHTAPMAEDADLGGYGQAEIVADFIRETGLERATLVGNDSGGAISQIVATEHPEVVSRLVLTNCDSYEKFPPRLFKYLGVVAKVPGGLTVLSQSMRLPAIRRSPLAFGLLSKHGIDAELLDDWVRPGIESAEIRRDTRKFINGIDKSQTLAAAEKLPAMKVPALLAWAEEDRFFTVSDAERLAAAIPDSRLELIPDAKTFVALDQPERLAAAIAEFVAETAGAQSTAA